MQIRRTRALLLLSVFLAVHQSRSAEVKRIDNPTYFTTLVNPQCSHCVDEAKRRAHELRESDRVLAWIRGKYDGGAVPFRFFLVPYRVISDTYGVWVYDADAGFVRGYEPSLDFTFQGWRNGVVVIRHKDGTLFSALSGVAFDGPRKGGRLKPLPTIETDWGYWLKAYPGTVAYNMFDKYKPVDLPQAPNADSISTRPSPDKRLGSDEMVIGINWNGYAKAYPISMLATNHIIRDRIGTQEVAVLWYAPTKTAAIYAPRVEGTQASTNLPPLGGERENMLENLKLEYNAQISTAPFMDKETFSHWSIEGRAMEGPLKGKTLIWLPGLQCKWFAWAAEYPQTEIFSTGVKQTAEAEGPMMARLIEGERLDWDALAKTSGYVVEKSSDGKSITVYADSDKQEHQVTVTFQTEFHVEGGWGTLADFYPKQNVFVIATRDKKKQWQTLHALADELSMQGMSRPFRLTAYNVPAGKMSFADPKAQRGSLELKTDNSTRTILAPGGRIEPSHSYYFQSSRDGSLRIANEILDETSFAARRQQRSQTQRERLEQTGFGATISSNARLSLTLMVRRADAWHARAIRPGDSVRISRESLEPILGRVEDVRPDYSRLRLRLSAPAGARFGEGDTVFISAKLPATADWQTPLDLGRFKLRRDRIDYFLSTIYCPCGMMGTSCAGHWNTLAACKLHGCGMPNLITKELDAWIDSGKDDVAIWKILQEQYGPNVIAIHQN